MILHRFDFTANPQIGRKERQNPIYISIKSSHIHRPPPTQPPMPGSTEIKHEETVTQLPQVIPLPAPPPAPKKDLNKFLCPVHKQYYRYRCTSAQCSSPFACHLPECLEEHFHEGQTLTVSRFNAEIYKSAFKQMESCKDRIEKHYAKAMVIKSQLDVLRSSMTELMLDFRLVNSLCQTIHQQLDRTLSKTFQGTLDHVVDAELKIKHSIEELKKKIFVPPEEETLREGPSEAHFEETIQTPTHLTRLAEPPTQLLRIKLGQHKDSEGTQTSDSYKLNQFLQAHIPNYQLADLKVLYEGVPKEKMLEELHCSLAGKPNLLMLIEGQSLTSQQQTVLGCYFTAKYPSLAWPTLTDLYSFVFFQDDTAPQGFIKFLAHTSSNQERHLEISTTGLQIGGGGLAIHGLDCIVDYSFPTSAYVSESKEQSRVADTIRIVKMRVLCVDKKLNC